MNHGVRGRVGSFYASPRDNLRPETSPPTPWTTVLNYFVGTSTGATLSDTYWFTEQATPSSSSTKPGVSTRPTLF